jgi:hypothetical protein
MVLAILASYGAYPYPPPATDRRWPTGSPTVDRRSSEAGAKATDRSPGGNARGPRTCPRASLLRHDGVGLPWRASGPDRPDQAPLTVGAVADKRAWVVVQGSAPVAPGEKLFVVYADGARERLKVTWVRKQVRPGLSYICQCYHHVIPRAHRAYSRRPIAVELMHGRRTVARQALLPPSG